MSESVASRSKLYLFWPLLGIALGGFLLATLVGLPTGSLGQGFSSYFVSHLGFETSIFGSLFVILTAFRDLRKDRVRGIVRWLSLMLLVGTFSILSAQLTGSQSHSFGGGLFGIYFSDQLKEAFGVFSPLLSILVFSLALVSWGGLTFRLAAQRIVSNLVGSVKNLVVRVSQFRKNQSSSEQSAQFDSVEKDADFKNKPFQISDLVKDKNVSQELSDPYLEEDEEVDDVEDTFEDSSDAEEDLAVEEEIEPEKQKASPQKKKGRSVAQLPLNQRKKPRKKKTKLPQIHRAPGEYKLPPIDLLNSTEQEESTIEELQKINKSAQDLQDALMHFNLNVQVVGIQQGPVITQYELELAPGIKVSRVMNLQNDIAMAMKARSVRILAPIPGKSTVGVEVPNSHRRSVDLCELIENSSAAEIRRQNLPYFIGRNIFGEPVSFDISQMPHLLMAGATGAGKSVGINCLIVSLLMTRSPDEVKLILVDPKQVELNFYKGIPHLVSPVITDMKKVPGILDWAVRKMEERYDLLARVGVRDIISFNKLGEKAVYERLGITEEDGAVVDTYMPRIVIIVDELADLMMLSSAAKEVEANVQRLAQKSRAVGIHVVLATQRPSVDVITGVIKANLPCRIAYMVNSAIDSRTILDRKGAETLLGRGDMLFKDPGRSDFQRLQGAFISEEEVSSVVDFWKEQGKPTYIEELLNPMKSDDEANPRQKDELYEKAVRLVLESRRGSTTFLQRMMGVGYTRASRLIELMESEGLVGPHKGSVSRDVLYTWEEYESQLQPHLNEDTDDLDEVDEASSDYDDEPLEEDLEEEEDEELAYEEEADLDEEDDDEDLEDEEEDDDQDPQEDDSSLESPQSQEV